MRRLTILVTVVLVATIAAPGFAAHTDRYPSHTSDGCGFPVTSTDATGTEVTIDEEPRRVVSLNPSATQTMWEIGAREKVVGVTKYAEYLDGAQEREYVSSETDIVVHERVVELRPDLVLAPSATDVDSVEKLRESGLSVYYFEEEESIDDVYAKTDLIGHLTGECEGAAATVESMRTEIETVQRVTDGERRPDVLYIFFGYTAGEGTFIDELIELAGGNNVAADAGISGYREISAETIVERDPDWIVLNTNDPAIPDDPALERTTAVERDQIVVIPIEHLNQPAPRVVRAVTAMAEAFHPGAYAAENASNGSVETAPTSEPENGSSSTNDTSNGSPDAPEQPGFGPLVAVIAVAVTVISRSIGPR